TRLCYDSTGKLTTITKPAGSASQRAQATYTYDTANPATWTKVNLAGFSPTSGYARKVSYDEQGRITKNEDANGNATQYFWNDAQNVPFSTIDSAGHQTSTTYDASGRPTDVWGPADKSNFDDAGTNPTHMPSGGATVPHSTTRYDENMPGLAA